MKEDKFGLLKEIEEEKQRYYVVVEAVKSNETFPHQIFENLSGRTDRLTMLQWCVDTIEMLESQVDHLADKVKDLSKVEEEYREYINKDPVKRTLSASEALYGFASWLTSRKERVVLSSKDNATSIANLVEQYCKANDLKEPIDGWDDLLVRPPELKKISPRIDKVDVKEPEKQSEVSYAVEVLTKAISRDEDFRRSYRANIAMAFVDEMIDDKREEAFIPFDILHNIAGRAADRFLDNWCRNRIDPMVKEIEDEHSQEVKKDSE